MSQNFDITFGFSVVSAGLKFVEENDGFIQKQSSNLTCDKTKTDIKILRHPFLELIILIILRPRK